MANLAQVSLGLRNDIEARAFIGRASTLFDRLGGSYEPVECVVPSASRVEARIARWRIAVDPGGHPEAFANRLRHLQVRERQLPQLLGQAVLSKAGLFPPWFERLTGLQDQCGAEGSIRDLIGLATIRYAASISKVCAEKNVILSPGVEADIRRAIETAVMNVIGPAIEDELQVLSVARASSLSRFLGTALSVREINAGVFLRSYPVAGRLLICAAEGCANNLHEAFVRLSEDFLDLRVALGLLDREARVASVLTGLSDRHEGGRTVVVIRLGSGERIVYKPKPLQAEAWFRGLLEELSITQDTARRYPRHLLRDRYGWASYVGQDQASESLPLCGAEMAGATLFALYVARAIDMHYQNVRIVDGHPVIVDCETLLHPDPWQTPFALPLNQASQTAYWQSVLRTMFLPQWMTDPEVRPVAVGGAGTVLGIETLIDAEAQLAAFTFGFRTAYDEALRLKCWADPIMQSPRKMAIRYLVRPTSIYADLLGHSLASSFLRNGVDRSLELEVLARYYLPTGQQIVPQDILDAEIDALERLDIPRFTLLDDEMVLRESDRTVCSDFVAEPPWAPLSELSKRLNTADRERQTRFIRLAADAHRGHRARREENQGIKVNLSEAFDVDRLLRLIEEETLEQATEADAGMPAWLSIQSVRGTDRYQFAPLDASLYDGTAGLALYLAYSSRTTGNEIGARLAVQSLQSVASFSRSEPVRAVRAFGCGGMHGVGALIYAFRNVGFLLHEESLIEAAVSLTSALRERQWDDETPSDMVFGTAGLLCVLLGDSPLGTSTAAMDAAERCVDHLERQAVSVHGSGLAWRDLKGRFQTGFSHGSAGVAYALVRYVAAGTSSRIKNTIEAAWDFEDGVYHPETRTWGKYGDQRSEEHGHSWCHGAPGILLGRYAHPQSGWTAASLAGRPPLTVLTPTRRHTLDQLCCGHAGRAAIAADLGSLRPDYADHLLGVREAERELLWKSWRAHRAFALLPGAPRSAVHVGLMQGTSGIALSLLASQRSDVPAFWRLE